MTATKSSIVIVDPFSTGNLYAPLFKSLGMRCIAVLSSHNTTPWFMASFRKEDFDEVLAWSSAAEEALQQRDVRAVVAGCETAVFLTDFLADLLGLPGNPLPSTASRRHKYKMQDALANAGLRHIASSFVSDESGIGVCLESLSDGPYIVKPANSAAAEGVVLAHGKEGVERALRQAAWEQVNDLGERNLGFLVQKFVSGPEYVVDMVAFGEIYHVASVCKYNKISRNGGDFVYESLVVLQPSDAFLKLLLAYARSAARALDIRVGPVHMEIIWSKEGPVMVEAGSRLHGGVAPKLFSETYSPDLLTLAVESYVGRSQTLAAQESHLKMHGLIGFLYSDSVSRLEALSTHVESQLSQIASYRGHRYFIAPGETTSITIDFATCPGLFWLCHNEAEQLNSDARICRSLLSPKPTSIAVPAI